MAFLLFVEMILLNQERCHRIEKGHLRFKTHSGLHAIVQRAQERALSLTGEGWGSGCPKKYDIIDYCTPDLGNKNEILSTPGHT